MYSFFFIVGLGISLMGTFIVTLADAWFSRAVLVYLDALESHLMEVVESLKDGGSQLKCLEIDLKRDQGQNRARTLKMLGWITLNAGFAFQFTGLFLGQPS